MGKAQKIKAQRKQAQVEKKKKRRRFRNNFLMYSGIALITLILGLGGSWGYQKLSTKSKEESKEKKMYTQAPEMQIDENKTYIAVMETDQGTMKIELKAKDAPKTVNNFVFLSREGFYDGLTFHRIIKTFMIQGGDPKGDGTGNPGYKFEDENLENAQYEKGTIAMANSGPNTNGSQFFIMHQDNDTLPKNYTVFGQVIEGLDILDRLASVPVTDNGGENSKPVNPPKIITITIEEK